MPPARFHRTVAISYLLLASIHLIYWPYAEFVLDDWFVLGRYQQAREAGVGELVHTASEIVRNQFHGQFRYQWISFSLQYLLWLVAGYSPKVFFAASVLLHWACAIALYRLLARIEAGAAPAFLAGALFLLLPTAHGAVFWSFNCAFFLWSTLWFLLYLASLAASLKSGTLDRKTMLRQSALLLLALFSGDPVFALLIAGAPLLGWYLRSRLALRATLLAWATIAVSAIFYALFINRAPIFQSGSLRFDFSLHRVWANLSVIAGVYRKISGLTADSYYQLHPTALAALAVLVATATVVAGLRLAGGQGTRSAAATLGLAAALWLAAYGPILFLRAHEFRYDFTASPYLALALAAAVTAWRPLLIPAAAVLAGWLAWASVADIQQSWIPQARSLRVLGEKLRSLEAVRPDDLIIVSNATLWIGTAPHFALLAGWASTPFAERVTGVRGIEAACEIVDENGRLRVQHWNYMRNLGPDEAARTRLLVARKDRLPEERRLLAQQIRPGFYRLFALKGYSGPPPPAAPLNRDQLALMESEIYFAKPVSR